MAASARLFTDGAGPIGRLARSYEAPVSSPGSGKAARPALMRGTPMSDNELVLGIPHTLGAAEARRRIETGVANAKSQFASIFKITELTWIENRLVFDLSALAQRISGAVEVENDYVELRAQLPTLIRLLAKRFVPVVETTGQKLLLPKS
jgi:hypothetical protein